MAAIVAIGIDGPVARVRAECCLKRAAVRLAARGDVLAERDCARGARAKGGVDEQEGPPQSAPHRCAKRGREKRSPSPSASPCEDFPRSRQSTSVSQFRRGAAAAAQHNAHTLRTPKHESHYPPRSTHLRQLIRYKGWGGKCVSKDGSRSDVCRMLEITLRIHAFTLTLLLARPGFIGGEGLATVWGVWPYLAPGV